MRQVLRAKVLRASAFLVLSILVSSIAWAGSAWAGDQPIGTLTVKGQASITAGDSSFTLHDQEYAYFSGDRVETTDSAKALIATSQGLTVALDGSSVARLMRQNDVYTIDLQQGSMAVEAQPGVDYRLTRNGEAIAKGDRFVAGAEPYVATVTGNDDVELYMPAQLDAETERHSLLWLLGAGATAIGTFIVLDDDDGPSS